MGEWREKAIHASSTSVAWKTLVGRVEMHLEKGWSTRGGQRQGTEGMLAKVRSTTTTQSWMLEKNDTLY
jgi:hypothetical protein